jgi:amidase
VLLYELKADMAAYLAKRPSAKVRSLADIIEFNQRHRSRELRYFGQDLFEKAEKLGPLTDKAYLDALAQCRLMSREQGIDAAMGKHQLDAIIAPTSGPAHKTDLAIGDYGPGGSSTYPAVAGYPHITVPAGFIRDLPFGLSFFGRPRTEAKLIQFAYAYEQANPVRRKPGFLPPQFG